jgi:hypothetical protein
MPSRLFISLAVIVACAAACSDQSGEETRAQLLEMGRTDQEVRERIMGLLNDSGPAALSTDEFRSLFEEQQLVDERNFLGLEAIVTEHGWPDERLIGEEATGAAWIVMQHASIERQKRFLPLLRQAVAENRALASNLAMLEDEIALADQGKQIYGTEITMTDGKAMIAPVADPETIDERRASVGLPPIEEYLRRAEAELGAQIDRSALDAD